MTRRLNEHVMLIETEAYQQCDDCGKMAELRPYGKNGACICFECGMKDKDTVDKEFNKLYSGVSVALVEEE